MWKIKPLFNSFIQFLKSVRFEEYFMIPDDKKKPGRYYHLDGLRGLALAMMVFTHGMKNWIDPVYMTSFTDTVKSILTKIPAPLFIFLVGTSYVFSRNARLRRGLSEKAVFIYYARRSVFLLFMAYMYRIVDVIFGIPWKYIHWKVVDVLNVIAVSLFLVALFGFVYKKWFRHHIGFMVSATLFVIFAAVFDRVTFPDWIPIWISAYINGVSPNAYFTLFPFTGLVFYGAYMAEGGWLKKSLRSYVLLSALLGLLSYLFYSFNDLFAELGLLNAVFAKLGYFYAAFSFLTISIWLAKQFQKYAGFGPLLILGSNTMVAYWVHAKIIFIHYGSFLHKSTWTTSFTLLIKTYLLTFFISMTYIFVRDRIRMYLKKRKQAAAAPAA